MNAELLATFKARAENAHAAVHAAVPQAELARALQELLRTHPGPACAAPSLRALHSAWPAELVTPSEPAAVARAELGVCAAELAIAETGSVLLGESELLERLVSMLPPVSIVLLALDRLVASLDDAAAYLRSKTARSCYVSFVTGPSRTADIELVHTIGVHGPGELHIIPYHSS